MVRAAVTPLPYGLLLGWWSTLTASVVWLLSETATTEGWLAVGWGVIAGILAAQMAIDVAVRRLPLKPSLVGTGLFLFFVALDNPQDLIGPLVGLALMTGVAAALRLLSHGALGRGDLFLAPVLGAAIGVLEPRAVISAWVVISTSGALVALIGMMLGRLALNSKFPYGPFMVGGSALAILLEVGRLP